MRYAVAIAFLIFSVPAAAGGEAASVPEPSNLALAAMGFVGLVIGRHFARRP